MRVFDTNSVLRIYTLLRFCTYQVFHYLLSPIIGTVWVHSEYANGRYICGQWYWATPTFRAKKKSKSRTRAGVFLFPSPLSPYRSHDITPGDNIKKIYHTPPGDKFQKTQFFSPKLEGGASRARATRTHAHTAHDELIGGVTNLSSR